MRNLADTIGAVVDRLASGRSFYISLGIILLIGLFFRVLYLPADPPAGITKSQDFSTDPPQYTYFAHHLIEQGDSNPYNDPRYSQWEYTTQNLLAVVVYAITGTGRAQNNSIAVIFNLLSILLLALAIKNFGSRVGALFFAVLAAFDFTMIWFGRTPFLEASQNFWVCASVYFFSLHREKTWAVLAAGASCAIAAFFGKLIALYMLGPFTGLWIVLFFTAGEDRRELFKKVAYYYGGFIAVALLWLFVIYLPSQSQVSGYFAEQALGLYGSPAAFKAVTAFFATLNTLLWERSFFQKMPIVTVFGFLGGAAVLYWLAVKGKAGRWFKNLNTGWVLVMFWCAIGYLSLFPWNYRPLRYQTTIIFPTMALAALILGYAWDQWKEVQAEKKSVKRRKSSVRLWQLLITWGLWLMPLLACVFFWLVRNPQELFYRPFLESPVEYSIGFILVGAAIAVIWHGVVTLGWHRSEYAKIGALLVILFFVIWNTMSFVDWSRERQYTLLTADRDIGAITNEGAVLSGPYGPAISLNNDRGTIMHMFGVVRVDKDLFAKYPITHLAMDEDNEKRAREDYPLLMNKAWSITRYFLRGIPVKVYNIAEGSPNPTARAYKPTDYEIALNFVAAGKQDSAEVYMARFLDSDIANYSADLYVGDALVAVDSFKLAIEHYRKVQKFAPGDPVSALGLGNAMMSFAGTTNDPAWFDSALVYYRVAQIAYPDNAQINNVVSQLERREQ